MRKTTTALSAFSLIELLCALGLIAILASLLLSAVVRAYGRAKRMQVEFEAPAYADMMRERLVRIHETMSSHPALSAEQWRALGVFDDNIMRFLRRKEVVFRPFASTSSPETVVLELRFPRRTDVVLRKADLKPPEP